MTSGSRDLPATPGADASDGNELVEIRRRLDALERAVRSEPAKPVEAAKPPAAVSVPGAPAAGATR